MQVFSTLCKYLRCYQIITSSSCRSPITKSSQFVFTLSEENKMTWCLTPLSLSDGLIITWLVLGLWCFNATFNNISVMSWRSDPPQVTNKLYHIVYRVHLALAGFALTTFVVIGTDYIGSYKFNDHTITTTTSPNLIRYCAQCPLFSCIKLHKRTVVDCII